MTRVAVVSFLLLSGFFYLTGRPVDDTTNPVDFSAQTSESGDAAVSTGNTVTASAEEQVVGSERDDTPAPPVRNPLRGDKGDATKHTAAATLPSLAVDNSGDQIKAIRTVAAATPLFESYQQRYEDPKQPVLGPRLTAVLIKRELRRVGCYGGNITGAWDDEARAAIEQYNVNSDNSLAIDEPAVATLNSLRHMTKTVCGDDNNRAIVATTAGTGVIATLRRSSNRMQWRSNNPGVDRAAYRPGDKRLRQNLADNSVDQTQVTEGREQKNSHRANLGQPSLIARRPTVRKTAVRGWKKQYRRKKFGFKAGADGFTLNY